MILKIIIATFLIVNNPLLGQSNGLTTKLLNDEYTWDKVSMEQLDSFYLDLSNLRNTKYETHIRVFMKGQTLDFYSAENKKNIGFLTNYIIEYSPFKSSINNSEQNKAYQYVYEKYRLNDQLVDSVVNSMICKDFFEIPTDSLISNWELDYVHCNGIKYQYMLNGTYSQKTFRCPQQQNDTLKEKALILKNMEVIQSLFKLDSLYLSFTNILPSKKTYSPDGFEMLYILSMKQNKNWNKSKPIRDYQKSIKDIIDNYLNSELLKKKNQFDKLICYDEYLLEFNKKGKLKNIKINTFDKEKIENFMEFKSYLTEKKEIRKCISTIKKIFIGIELGFVNPKSNIYRMISFYQENEFQLIDNTIY
ncbi:MAG: hypothetical protein HYR91_03510 [Flavobacteriia bacterium]|nr:hypothetical protein [Flavobacteriia bacterium]